MNLTKSQRYLELVAKFKTHVFTDQALINPHKIFKELEFDFNVINPWELWHNNLNAEILFIGQDFSDTASLRNNLKDNWEKEKSLDTNKTIINFFSILGPRYFFNEVDYTPKTKQRPLFFTNAISGIKQSQLNNDGVEKEGMSLPVKDRWYLDTLDYLKELIEIVEPKYIIAMGKNAYKAVCKIYNIIPKETMFKAIGVPIVLPNNKTLFVVQHCSRLGQRSRPLKQQYNDWMDIRNIIDPA